PQFLLVFDASGRQYIGESIVYPTTYRRARFAIHSLVGRADSLSLALGPLYSALFASGNSTIVIRGYLWISGVAMPFMFRSAEEGVGSAEFDTPFTVGTDLPKEVLVNFSTVSAFTDVSGKIMDPRDGRNAAAIEAHLKTSLHAIVNPESR
ncbi:MAG: hypothetical protein Q8896_10205, partial [Bacteroidota bacterium]|nr:hypothetical protein [Bacteroidota bacterium]